MATLACVGGLHGVTGIPWSLCIGIGIISIVVLWLPFCGLFGGCGDFTGDSMGVLVGAGQVVVLLLSGKYGAIGLVAVGIWGSVVDFAVSESCDCAVSDRV